MPAPQEIVELVERFERNRDSYDDARFNETQTRVQFLNPLFRALGWDVDNTSGYAEAYKDVVHEDALKGAGATIAPDYCFRVGGTRKFFLEAKKPSVNLKSGADPAFQLRRYAWSAKLPVSVLSNFSATAIYDCRAKPVKDDKASKARIHFWTCEQYVEKWDEIASIFSKEAVLRGSFDKFASGSRNKRGTAEVDAEFLLEIEEWRDLLARNIALRNSSITQRDLNFAVQQIIDRIIFLRICEDRGIEPYGRLQALQNGENVYERLRSLFVEADERYNSGLFHFREEKGRMQPPDRLTPGLLVDNKPLKDIFKRLYYPDSPYEFSVLPADILGQVYEQFLGKVIRLTAGGQAKVEDKPEVKKAGGVYYTPAYIVEYIVKQTVGSLLKNKTPKTLKNLAIVDPACGSGSFLLGAYQYLLDWYLQAYVKDGAESNAAGKRAKIFRTEKSGWRLTTNERKRILLEHIFGVDIDTQAVEVTKLSLLLKVLEDESSETIGRNRDLFHERVLPDLEANIKCGNSLIGPDFFADKLGLHDEERYRVNPFDWRAEYKEIFSRHGFDAVIGNPPYGALLTADDVAYLRQHYAAGGSEIDTYTLFMEQALRLSRSGGFVSMIVPTGWYSGAKFSAVRRLIVSDADPSIFVNLPYDIFAAWVDTTVFVVQKRVKAAKWPRTQSCKIKLKTFPKRHLVSDAGEFDEGLADAELTQWFEGGSDEFLTYADTSTTGLLQKISRAGIALGDCADVQRGVTPFVLAGTAAYKTSRPAFAGTVRRYLFERGEKKFIRFDETLAEPKPEKYFRGSRLLLRELISRQFRLQAVRVDEDFVTNKSMQSILPLPDGPNLHYLLGVLNSRLMSWYFLHKSQIAQRDDFPKIVLRETRALPVAVPSEKNKNGLANQQKLIAGVVQLLALYRNPGQMRTPHEKILLERQIEDADNQIDELVYALYDLTRTEIEIVEADAAA